MGLFDGLFGSDEESQNYLSDALRDFQNVSVPDVASEQVQDLPMESVEGAINPESVGASTQDTNAYDNINLDPSSRAAQEAALSGYTDIANSGGLDAAAKLGIQEANDSANTLAQGQRGALQAQAQAEGQGGGANSLVLQAIANQGSANTAANAGMTQAAEAEANREAALGQMANIGGNINASDASQAAAKANAANTIAAQNTATRNATNNTNVANNLAAQNTNLANKQSVNDANTTAGQNQAYYNASQVQQQFNNELAKANGMAGVSNNQATNATAVQNNNTNATGQLLGGVAKGAGSYLAASDGAYIDCMKSGGHVPGHACIPGDSPTNDTVPALLSPGELVIPRSVPKTGSAMAEFAKHAPMGGDKSKPVDLTKFTADYKKPSVKR